MNARRTTGTPLWLLLTFTLPVKKASQRVQVWRKLQRYGAVPLGNSGYLLPTSPENQERFEWLATAVRRYAGEASVLRVEPIDNLSTPQWVGRFSESRARQYQELIRGIQKACRQEEQKRRGPGHLSRLRARFREIVEIDFFNSSLQKRVEELLERADSSPIVERVTRVNPKEYTDRIWVTRPRPGIARSASAWLIRRYIDTKARFAFAEQEDVPPEAVAFDMFHAGGFGHRGEDCTFETLEKSFRIRDRKVKLVGQIIHDADILDEKYGRKEGFGLDEVLKGWSRTGISDRDLLHKGVDLIEGLYHSLV